MRALSTGLLAVAIFVVGVGFFRLWFVLSGPAPQAGNEKVNVSLTGDTHKVKQDAKVVTNKPAALTNTTGNDVKADGRVNDSPKSINH